TSRLRAWAHSTTLSDDTTEFLVNHLDLLYDIALVQARGFFHYDVRIGMERWLAREIESPKMGKAQAQALDEKSRKNNEQFYLMWRLLKLNNVDTAIYNAMLHRCRLPGFETQNADNRVVVDTVSRLLALTDIRKLMQTGYICVLLCGIERLFFKR